MNDFWRRLSTGFMYDKFVVRTFGVCDIVDRRTIRCSPDFLVVSAKFIAFISPVDFTRFNLPVVS